MSSNNIYDWSSKLLWKDENFDLTSARTTAGSLPDLITIPGTNIEIAVFDGNNLLEQISCSKEINHDYAQGTLIYPHVHFYPTVSGTGNVKWFMDYWAKHSDNPSTTVSGVLTTVVSVSGIAAWDMIYGFFPALDLGALAKIGTQLHFRFYRNPADSQDTYGSDVAVGTFGWHYQTDSRGSDTISDKSVTHT